MRMTTPSLLALLVSSTLIGCALDSEIGGEDEIADEDLGGLETSTDAIVNGTPAPNDRSVVLVYHQISDTQGSLCTGTMIGPRIVLTAAHCVPPSAQFGVISTNYDGIKGPFIKIIDHRVYPNWKGAGGNDLALLELEKSAGVPSIPLNSNPLGFTVGKSVRLLGYGDRDPGAANVYGLRFQGTGKVVLRQTNGNVVIGKAPSVVLPGDSGGPTFIRVGTQDYLAGVHSVVYFSSSGEPIYSGDTAVDKNLSWILSNKTILEAL